MYVKLWELLRSVPLTGETPDLDMEINSISYDTRTIKPGALFAALPGARDDGARHIREALDRGAAAVLCRERPEEDGPWLVTPDPRRALALLSANWFGRPAEGLTLESTLGTDSPEDRMVEHIALREAIDQLPEREKMTILLRFFKGLTQEQTARILGVSQVQISRLERRGLKRLREFLSP